MREPPNLTKEQLHVMLVLNNVQIVPLNVRKKNKEIPECDESSVTCDVGIA